MNEIKSFVLRNSVGIEIGLFTCRQHRQDTLKAAYRMGGIKDKPMKTRFRGRRIKKVHILMGRKELIPATKNKPG